MRSAATVSVPPTFTNSEGPACGQSVSESTHGLVMGTLQLAAAVRATKDRGEHEDERRRTRGMLQRQPTRVRAA